MEPQEIIYFSYYKKEYHGFTNFAKYSFEIDGIVYKTSEHFYQAMKFKNTDKTHFLNIVNAATPSIAKTLGHSKKHPMESDWDTKHRIPVMKIALYAKFTQNPSLKKKLTDTGNALLKEDNPWDAFWGIGRNGKGKNMLGVLLMELRENMTLMI